MRFDWRAPLDPSVTGYILFENYPRIILEHNLSSSEVCVGDVCSWTLGWQGNGTYRYSAAALNSRGDGRASHQRFTVNVALPSMVSGLAAVQQISGSSWNNVMVSWPPVQVNGVVDRAIMEYEVSGLGAPRTVMPDDCTGPSPRSCTTSFSGLSPGVHQFTVLTRNSAGVGPAAIATVDVQNPASGPLRAEWTGVPSFYTSLDPFTLQLEFSEPVDVSAAKLRDHVIRVTRGRVSSVRAGMGGDGSSWSVTVVPSQLSGDVLVEVVGRFPCSMRRAICGSGNRQLENSPYVYVSFAGGLTAGVEQRSALVHLSESGHCAACLLPERLVDRGCSPGWGVARLQRDRGQRCAGHGRSHGFVDDSGPADGFAGLRAGGPGGLARRAVHQSRRDLHVGRVAAVQRGHGDH